MLRVCRQAREKLTFGKARMQDMAMVALISHCPFVTRTGLSVQAILKVLASTTSTGSLPPKVRGLDYAAMPADQPCDTSLARKLYLNCVQAMCSTRLASAET